MTPTRGEHRNREGAEQREPSDGEGGAGCRVVVCRLVDTVTGFI
jgi:hypothetical protein